MYGLIFKMFAVAFACLFIVYSIGTAFRRARRLDRRIRDYKKEQAELARRGGPINPYAGLAGLYAEEEKERIEQERRRAAKAAAKRRSRG